MGNKEITDDERDEQLALSYELFVLYGVPVLATAAQELDAAYRRVHLRGLDPLRNNQA